jgi:hypothetical protein
MLDRVKSPAGPAPATPFAALSAPSGGAYTLGELRVALAPHTALPLVFEYGGRAVQPGYHVTEVKSGSFASLDCGAKPESWRETVIQLWDVPEDTVHMRTAKFLAIMEKVMNEIDFDQDSRLTFEVSDGEVPMQLFRALAIDAGEDSVRVTLGSLPASCKPRDRWFEDKSDAVPASCCGPAATKCGCG